MSEQKTHVCQKPFKVFVSKTDMLEDELTTLKAKLAEVEGVLTWASENVWTVVASDGEWRVRIMVSETHVKMHTAPTLYEALRSAWEGREK